MVHSFYGEKKKNQTNFLLPQRNKIKTMKYHWTHIRQAKKYMTSTVLSTLHILCHVVIRKTLSGMTTVTLILHKENKHKELRLISQNN